MPFVPCALARPSPAADPLRVMTFNIRYGTAKDGENHWDKRKEFLVETIKAFDPDLLGTQETLGFQRDYLAEKLPGYGVLGVGRDDGKEKGEMMALYYKQARFEKLDGGPFLAQRNSRRPSAAKAGTRSLPRMVTWVRLQDRRTQPPPPILFVNTHFDHRGPTARLESAKLLRQRIESGRWRFRHPHRRFQLRRRQPALQSPLRRFRRQTVLRHRLLSHRPSRAHAQRRHLHPL